MGIIYCEKDRTFTLQTKETTYQMQVDQYGFLLHLYYGKKAEGCMDYLPEIPMMREQTEPIPWTLFHRSFPATETEISAVHH